MTTQLYKATVRGVPDVIVAKKNHGTGYLSLSPIDGFIFHPAHLVTDLRPLVVLDPGVMLRSLIPVTKPEEPKGLGAVVEADGQRYVRTRAGNAGHLWFGNTGSSVSSHWFRWDQFPDTVKVLSEGLSQ